MPIDNFNANDIICIYSQCGKRKHGVANDKGKGEEVGRLTEAEAGAAFACSLHKKTRVERSF